MKVLVLVPFEEAHISMIENAAGEGCEVRQLCDELTDEELAVQLDWADAVIGEPKPSVLTNASDVKLVQMTWAGTDLYTRSSIPFPAGTALCNAVGSYGHIISQYVVGQILTIAQKLNGYQTLQQQGVWGDLGSIASLEGSTVLIFGAGNIGGETARRLQGFDVKRMIGVCRNTQAERPYFTELCTLGEAEAFLPEADVVVGAIPNSDQTKGYLNEARLRVMKDDAILVNVGRGNFIDNSALATVLAEGKLMGAALDVTDPEPLPAGHPLWAEPKCLITPHVSGGAFRHPGTVQRNCNTACENIKRLRNGEELFNRVI